MKKTRRIRIKRTVTITNEDGKTQKQIQWFPCKVNASVPSSHKMLS